MSNEKIPTNDLRSRFYMRQVERHFNDWGYYPDHFLCELIKCDYCGGYFSEKNMYRFRGTWSRYSKVKHYNNQCNLCQQLFYFRSLAKQKIYKETGMFAGQQPDDLINHVAKILMQRRTELEVKLIIRNIRKVIKKRKVHEKQS